MGSSTITFLTTYGSPKSSPKKGIVPTRVFGPLPKEPAPVKPPAPVPEPEREPWKWKKSYGIVVGIFYWLGIASAYYFYIGKTDFISANKKVQVAGLAGTALSLYEALIVPFVPGAPSLLQLVVVIA